MTESYEHREPLLSDLLAELHKHAGFDDSNRLFELRGAVAAGDEQAMPELVKLHIEFAALAGLLLRPPEVNERAAVQEAIAVTKRVLELRQGWLDLNDFDMRFRATMYTLLRKGGGT